MQSDGFDQIIAELDAACRRRDIRMLGPQKAARLCDLVREARPEVVVEVGTAIGYSALWIAHTLAELGRGRLLTYELDPARAAEAAGNFQRAGLASRITQVVGDARTKLTELTERIDFLFLDGGFGNYYAYLLACLTKLRDGATLLADNAGIGATEMADYLNHVRAHFRSRTEWFVTDLAWNRRDAMEVSVVGDNTRR